MSLPSPKRNSTPASLGAARDAEKTSSVLDRVHALRQQLGGLTQLEQPNDDAVSTGCEALDRLLPGGCLRPGMLVEWLSETRGSGAGTLATHCATRMIESHGGSLVVADRWRRFYPPAAVARGIESKQLIVVRSSETKIMSAQEELWALDQALRCPAVSAVMTWIDAIDPRAFRRLQLAAEAGQTLALLMRPAHVRAQPTWSDVQLLVRPQTSLAIGTPKHLENRTSSVTLVRQRGRAGSATVEGTSVMLEINELDGTLKRVAGRNEANTLHMAPRMAPSTNRRRQTGA